MLLSSKSQNIDFVTKAFGVIEKMRKGYKLSRFVFHKHSKSRRWPMFSSGQESHNFWSSFSCNAEHTALKLRNEPYRKRLQDFAGSNGASSVLFSFQIQVRNMQWNTLFQFNRIPMVLSTISTCTLKGFATCMESVWHLSNAGPNTTDKYFVYHNPEWAENIRLQKKRTVNEKVYMTRKQVLSEIKKIKATVVTAQYLLKISWKACGRGVRKVKRSVNSSQTCSVWSLYEKWKGFLTPGVCI